MASLVVYMFAMGQAIYFREERAGGGRVSENRKKNHAQEKEENKFVHNEAWERMGRLYASPTSPR